MAQFGDTNDGHYDPDTAELHAEVTAMNEEHERFMYERGGVNSNRLNSTVRFEDQSGTVTHYPNGVPKRSWLSRLFFG